VEMPARIGKSAAINRAMQELRDGDEVFVMTDAEATLEDGALRRIGRWMKDPSIGAVCGCINESDRSTYRGWYRWFRSGESRADSTPIFEGSIAAYRASALHPIEVGANADDSQLAVLVRNEGLRTISDESIRFSEVPITDLKEKHDRTVRRGQGLSRHFWRHRSSWFRKGRWGTILGLNGLQHSISPWFVLLGILAGMAHATTVLLIGWFGGEPMLLDRVMLLLDAVVLASLGIGLTGLRVPLCASAVAFLTQNLRLVQGMVLLRFGRSLHQWDASKSNRLRR
jgi:cellulose synthase/poly-beta-1,6-N-acetylglucosamine synthase-like glycosyltransferase